MIKIRKPNVQYPLPREQGIMMVTGQKTIHISKRGWRRSSFVIKRMFTKGDSSLSHTVTPVPGSGVLFRLKRNKGLVRNRT